MNESRTIDDGISFEELNVFDETVAIFEGLTEGWDMIHVANMANYLGMYFCETYTSDRFKDDNKEPTDEHGTDD